MCEPSGMDDLRSVLTDVVDRVVAYRESTTDRSVFPTGSPEASRALLGSLPDEPTPTSEVIARLSAAAVPLLVATAGPRFFGFVVGGALPAATAADMLTSGWDQVGFNTVSSPAAAVVEDVAGQWLRELFGIPSTATFGFVTGGQAANTTALATARHHVLAEHGWNVERDGLFGAPRLRIVVNGERHATIDRSLRLLGIGEAAIEPVATDAQGAIDVADLRRVLAIAPAGPTIVCLQAGNVNSGAFDDLHAAITVSRAHGAWVHLDGAFGLWAAASPTRRHLVDGLEDADSWATDGHKWLNVPYDCGYVFCNHPDSHSAAMAYTAAYLTGQGDVGLRSPGEFVPESSRRARGFATWAALCELGRRGIGELIDRNCDLAVRFASLLAAVDGIEVVNDVVLNQVLVRFGDDDGTTDRVVEAVQRSGECWMGATTWHGVRLMRLSVSNWSTTEADITRSARAICAAAAEELADE